MNLILLSSVGLSGGTLAYGFVMFFIPQVPPAGAGGITATDALGNDVTIDAWKAAHQPNDRALVQGLKGDATYLISTETGVKDFAINAVCTHLGCVVPWSKANNKFMCPCHGSQYDENGKVVRGPAPLSLAIEHVNIEDDGKVKLSSWSETDFRTGEAPWWSF